MNPARWRELMAALGLGDQATMYGQLAAAYAEPHRHYHTARLDRINRLKG